jgi:hypothetical protein
MACRNSGYCAGGFTRPSSGNIASSAVAHQRDAEEDAALPASRPGTPKGARTIRLSTEVTPGADSVARSASSFSAEDRIVL